MLAHCGRTFRMVCPACKMSFCAILTGMLCSAMVRVWCLRKMRRGFSFWIQAVDSEISNLVHLLSGSPSVCDRSN